MRPLTGCCPVWATASKCSGGQSSLTYRSERRSWRLHRQLSSLLTKGSLEEWRPVIERNLQRLRSSVTGQPHSRNLDRWDSLVERGDMPGPHRVLTGLDRDPIEMREVSPMSGLLPRSERQAVLPVLADVGVLAGASARWPYLSVVAVTAASLASQRRLPAG